MKGSEYFSNELELWYEPREILKDDFYAAEMSPQHHAFLCGLLRKYKPKKIVEIGVAAGGTTAVILNALHIMGMRDTKLYSIDSSARFYRDTKLETGYKASEAKQYLGGVFNHEWLLGKYAYQHVYEIGKGIDFIILDTVHAMPGELLDFLAYYPYLREDAIVAMHDVGLWSGKHKQAVATQILLEAVAAKKILVRDDNTESGYPNIAAFQINKDTDTYIGDAFSALTLPWAYIPEELEGYRELYIREYHSSLIELFDMAVAKNIKAAEDRRNISYDGIYSAYRLLNHIEGKSVYIYGNGKIGMQLRRFLSNDVKFQGYIVSDGEIPKEDNVIALSNYKKKDEDVVVIGVGRGYRSEIETNCKTNGIEDYVLLEDDFLNVLMNQ